MTNAEKFKEIFGYEMDCGAGSCCSECAINHPTAENCYKFWHGECLNEWNDQTKKTVHIMTTNLCDRDCPHCCNKQYNVKDIPVVTDKELDQVEDVFITGGEPFAYGPDPCELAVELIKDYENIKRVMAYTNAHELYNYLDCNPFYGLDGLTISLKHAKDYIAYSEIIKNQRILNLRYVRVLVMYEKYGVYEFRYNRIREISPEHFEVMTRPWQEVFKPDPNSFFRRWNEEVGNE